MLNPPLESQCKGVFEDAAISKVHRTYFGSFSLFHVGCSRRRCMGGKASAMAAAPNPTIDDPMKSQE